MTGKQRALCSCTQDSDLERLKKPQLLKIQPLGCILLGCSVTTPPLHTSGLSQLARLPLQPAQQLGEPWLCGRALPWCLAGAGPHPDLCLPFLSPAQLLFFLPSSLSARGGELKFNFQVGSVPFLLRCKLLSPSFHPLCLPFPPSHPFLSLCSVG